MREILITVLKGLWIGGTLTVPGVSGGSMAMILGIYDKLINSVNALIGKGGDKKKSICYLAEAGIAGGIGFILFARLVSWLMTEFPVHVCFFFVGAIIGSMPLIVGKAAVKRLRLSDLVCILVGAAFVLGISFIPDGFFSFSGAVGLVGFLTQLLGGFIVAIGFVLPGISLSQMLYMFGIYEELMNNISTLNILPLVPFGIGGVAGVLFTSFTMGKVMLRFPRQTYLVIFGFLLGSVPQIFTSAKIDFSGAFVWDIVIYAALFAAGFGLIYLMSLAERSEKSRAE